MLLEVTMYRQYDVLTQAALGGWDEKTYDAAVIAAETPTFCAGVLI